MSKTKKEKKNILTKRDSRFVLFRKIFFIFNIFIIFISLVLFVSPVLDKQDKVKIIDGLSIENKDKIQLEEDITRLVNGYPMQQMVPYIIEKDPTVAAFLVSIAKKESNFGKRSPVLDGKDCFNYWGYRGIRDRMGTGGHTCFDSPEDAVDTVAARIERLMQSGVDTPKEMIVWKCGFSCNGHSNTSVQKWISDVSLFFKKFSH